MAPSFKRPPPDPEAPLRVGGYVTYRKRGGRVTKALIQWVHQDGSMRVKPELGRLTIIDADDIKRGAV